MKYPRSTEEAVRVIDAFDSLPVEKRLEIFGKLSLQAKEELLEITARPGEIIRRISEEEVYFLVKSIGEEHCPGLIRAATGGQLRYILDLELWRKDMFNSNAALRWMEIIAAIGNDKVLHFLQTVDPELVLTALHRFVRVAVRDAEVDLLEQRDFLPAFTLDNLFFVEFLNPEAEATIKTFLETIFLDNVEYYFGIMEELACGIITENEEIAFKWRRARLSDHGFPEFDEAVEIYRYLSPKQISLTIGDSVRYDDQDGYARQAALEYPVQTMDTESFFRSCLDRVGNPQEKDRLATELAHLANKVIVADSRDPASIDDIRAALKKVGGYINIAAEELCEHDTSRAAHLIASNHMEILFRRGFSLILDLRKQAQRLLREQDGGVENLGHPLAELVKGLLHKRPYFAGNVLGDDTVREFETLNDIRLIRHLMDTSAASDRWEPI